MSPTMVAMLAAITKLVSKCVRRINEQLLKTSGADVLLSMEILRKTSERGGTLPPPTRLVRPRVTTLWDLKGLWILLFWGQFCACTLSPIPFLHLVARVSISISFQCDGAG